MRNPMRFRGAKSLANSDANARATESIAFVAHRAGFGRQGAVVKVVGA